MEKIKIGIAGFGNIGKAMIKVIDNNKDMEIVGVFTRRDPKSLDIENVPAFHIDDMKDFTDKVDVMLLCGGSATDLPEQGPAFAKMFNTVDSFDTHNDIPEYLKKMNESSESGKKIAVVATGWDPGLFSINRLYGKAFLPGSQTYSFWGEGVSQGHSQAVRAVNGVENAVQYTIPVAEAMERVREGKLPILTTKEKHVRIVYVVPEEDANRNEIEQEIKSMPNYFADYNTTVFFITQEELAKNHSKMSHGGFVITSGKTSEENNQIMEYSLKLESNPEFTASVMVAYARAAHRLHQKGETGARTVFDIAPSMLCAEDINELIKEIL